MPNKSQGQKSLEEMSLRERLTLVLAYSVAAAGLGLVTSKNSYVRFYLHRYDPAESIAMIVVTMAALIWALRNTPRLEK